VKNEWTWWASSGGELYTTGPCDTREQVIQEMCDSGMGETFNDTKIAHSFEIAETLNNPLMLRDYIRANTLLEEADERVYDNDRVCHEYDEDVFTVTPAQGQDLQDRIKKACDDWQEANALVFTVRTFESMRSMETINIPFKEGEEL